MELKEYLGLSLIDDIKMTISNDAIEFSKQTPSTKLALCDQNNYALSVYKEGVKHLINVIDDVGAENELLESENVLLKSEVDRFQTKYGEINPDFINKQKSMVVIRDSKEKTHAKKACIKYIEKYNSQQRNN